ncbi:alpha2 protein [Hayes Yard virus]|uniref:Alpha2 protein n=1 Tax=Hayes Yard virus TaxID=2602440 RepID=A0A7D0IVF6_9RHAB|nr:alpha2 protein [Hayes Yard virus]QEA08656.1 alpha2 protein [Hayes Yard virus]
MGGIKKCLLSGKMFIRAGRKPKCTKRASIHKLELWSAISDGLQILEKPNKIYNSERREIEICVSRKINLINNWISKQELDGYGVEIELYSEQELESSQREVICTQVCEPDNYLLGEYKNYILELHYTIIKLE